MSRRWIALACAALAITSGGDIANAYLRQSELVGNRRVFLRWNQIPVRYAVNPLPVPGVTSAQLQAVLDRAFARWQNIPTSAIAFQSTGFTDLMPIDVDGVNTLGFLEVPELEGVLGATYSLFDEVTGELIESDIFFNSIESWSVADDGQTTAFDLESVAVHEIGHLLGLSHSALGYFETREGDLRLAGAESVMFPFAFDPGNTALRELQPDDIAGASEAYPDANFTSATGVMQGRVQKQGTGVFGAHVMAFNPLSGRMVAGFALTSNGEFSIAGLEPGRYVVRVEPIDDDDVSSYFPDLRLIDLDFRTMFFDRFVSVPAGGPSPTFDLEVQPR